MTARDYPIASRLLHRAVLGNRMMARTLFDIDCALTPLSATIADNRAVFITGLPRAGTTLLLNVLAQDNEFCGLTYRDMPFVMMPATWRAISARLHMPERIKPRFHEDGVMYGFDSPEAFEEVFWRASDGRFVEKDRLVPYQADRRTQDKFRHYISNIVTHDHDARRYLSKNNNNIMRLPVITRCLPKANIMVMVRDPLQQASSMLAQHRRFKERQKADAFFSDYIGWLGHYEFGLHHRPCIFPGDDGFRNHDHDTPDYWLGYWLHVYGYLIDNLPSGAVFADYDGLGSGDGTLPAALADFLAVDRRHHPLNFSRADRPDLQADAALVSRCRDLWAALRGKALA